MKVNHVQLKTTRTCPLHNLKLYLKLQNVDRILHMSVQSLNITSYIRFKNVCTLVIFYFTLFFNACSHIHTHSYTQIESS